jgi:hypothetical protein
VSGVRSSWAHVLEKLGLEPVRFGQLLVGDAELAVVLEKLVVEPRVLKRDTHHPERRLEHLELRRTVADPSHPGADREESEGLPSGDDGAKSTTAAWRISHDVADPISSWMSDTNTSLFSAATRSRSHGAHAIPSADATRLLMPWLRTSTGVRRSSSERSQSADREVPSWPIKLKRTRSATP